MKVALIADVHANLPALEAVLDHVRRRGDVAAIYHLGDLVGYAPWPNEVVALLEGFHVPGVAGNYDSTVATDYKHCGCRYEDPRQEELSHLSYAWTRAHVSASTKERLRRLPFRLDVRPAGGHAAGSQLILVHGTPTLNTVYWAADRPDQFSLRMAELAGAKPGDAIAFGHTHLPWHKEIEGIHFVNAGSAGRPKDGDWRACYVTLEWSDGGVAVEFARVEYDLERAMDAIRRSDLPDEFATVLQTGGSLKPVAEPS